MKEENLRLLAQSGTAADTSQLSFTNLGRDEVISRIKRTNIDEMTDEELREFHKELLKYL